MVKITGKLFVVGRQSSGAPFFAACQYDYLSFITFYSHFPFLMAFWCEHSGDSPLPVPLWWCHSVALQWPTPPFSSHWKIPEKF